MVAWTSFAGSIKPGGSVLSIVLSTLGQAPLSCFMQTALMVSLTEQPILWLNPLEIENMKKPKFKNYFFSYQSSTGEEYCVVKLLTFSGNLNQTQKDQLFHQAKNYQAQSAMVPGGLAFGVARHCLCTAGETGCNNWKIGPFDFSCVELKNPVDVWTLIHPRKYPLEPAKWEHKVWPISIQWNPQL